MPKTTIMSKRDVAQRAASLDKAIAKNVAKNVAKRAAKAGKAKRSPVTALGAIRQEIAAKAAAKAPRKGTLSAKLAAAATPETKAAHTANVEAARKYAKSVAKAAAKLPSGFKAPEGIAIGNGKVVTGAKAKIIDMIAADGGTTAADICKALGWVRAGATIGRAIKLATFKVAKVRDADGVLRYSREG
jgi:hypothetical protein